MPHRPGRRGAEPTAATLLALTRTAGARLALGDVGAADLRWAAARRAVQAAARARLRGRGLAARGALFAARPQGTTAEQDAALALVAEPRWPQQVAPPTFAELGALYPDLLISTARKVAGTWFTGRALAEPTARRVLGPLLAAGVRPRVCDPAVGAGMFLATALEQLAAGTAEQRHAIASTQLFGVDADPTAASLAAWSLHEACGEPAPDIAAIEAHVHAGDGLTAFDAATFDAVLGNPPWETLQLSRRTDGATAAAELALAARVSALRARFHCQGAGKLYTYRLFLERALQLLRPGGRLGLIVPASLYFDRDAAPLRERLLDGCDWEWLFSFENRDRLFAIDSRYRFGPIVARKGGTTVAVRAAFLRRDPAEWARECPPHLLYQRRELRALSPHSGAFVEVRDARDLDLLRRMHGDGEPLLGSAGAWSWQQGDFNMTSDAAQFVPRAEAERRGYRRAADGRWRHGDDDSVLRPLYQGAMVYDLHPNAGAFAGGAGRAVRWRPPGDAAEPEPQYLVRCRGGGAAPARVVLRALSNASNERSAIACLLGDEPCGNSLGVFTPRGPTATPVGDCAFLAGVLGSLCWDWALRQRLAGTNVNGFVLRDMVLPRPTAAQRQVIAIATLCLCAVLPWHERLWQLAAAERWLPEDRTFASSRALTDADRRLVRIRLDVAVARAFAFTAADLAWMLRDCDRADAELRRPAVVRRLDPKGFWRIDRQLPAAVRHPNAVLAAFQAGDPADLKVADLEVPDAQRPDSQRPDSRAASPGRGSAAHE